MSEHFATDNGLKLTDNNNTEKGLENLSPDKIEGFSPSMKLIINILENRGPLTQKEIKRITRLPSRTVRYVLTRLKEEGILEEREYFMDARQSLYGLNGNISKM